jgi:hypothetical protein
MPKSPLVRGNIKPVNHTTRAEQMRHLNIAAAISEIRHGFHPWTCLVELDNLAGQLRCRVVDISGRCIISELCLSSTDVVEPSKLSEAIQQVRAKLQRDGFALEDWKPRW